MGDAHTGGGQTPTHSAPIAAIAINDLTGDIATCCGTMLYLWTINGELVTSIDTSSASTSSLSSNVSLLQGAQSPGQLLCLAFSTCNEWDLDNVILSGSSDGIVKMWSVRYVQQPVQEAQGEKEVVVEEETASSDSNDSSLSDDVRSVALNPSKDDIVRRLSTVSMQNEEENNESTDDSNTPVDGNDNQAGDWEVLNFKEEGTTTKLPHSKSFGNKLDTTTSQFLSTKESSKQQQQTLGVPTSSIRNSKSETCITEPNVSVAVPTTTDSATDAILKPGHCWRPKLVFRSKLTMHTAFERKDNKEPAAITCLSLAKDHRTVFVGDARGRVYSWCVSDATNNAKNMSDHWVKDENVSNCNGCQAKFSMTERKHHCRNCGDVFCAR